MEGFGEGFGGVDEEVVAELEGGLIEDAAEGLRTAGSGDGSFGIVDEDVGGFVVRGNGGESAVAFAGLGAACAVKVEDALGVAGAVV